MSRISISHRRKIFQYLPRLKTLLIESLFALKLNPSISGIKVLENAPIKDPSNKIILKSNKIIIKS